MRGKARRHGDVTGQWLDHYRWATTLRCFSAALESSIGQKEDLSRNAKSAHHGATEPRAMSPTLFPGGFMSPAHPPTAGAVDLPRRAFPASAASQYLPRLLVIASGMMACYRRLMWKLWPRTCRMTAIALATANITQFFSVTSSRVSISSLPS